VSITGNARGRTMGFSCRTFLIARDDTLWRLSSTKFDRMLRDPASHRLPVFAGQRARMASVVVEIVARNPVRVVRNTFSILTFDAEGRIDASRFEKQQFALAESVGKIATAVVATGARLMQSAASAWAIRKRRAGGRGRQDAG
jgi:hypothetical protein